MWANRLHGSIAPVGPTWPRRSKCKSRKGFIEARLANVGHKVIPLRERFRESPVSPLNTIPAVKCSPDETRVDLISGYRSGRGVP